MAAKKETLSGGKTDDALSWMEMWKKLEFLVNHLSCKLLFSIIFLQVIDTLTPTIAYHQAGLESALLEMLWLLYNICVDYMNFTIIQRSADKLYFHIYHMLDSSVGSFVHVEHLSTIINLSEHAFHRIKDVSDMTTLPHGLSSNLREHRRACLNPLQGFWLVTNTTINRLILFTCFCYRCGAAKCN